MSEIIQNKSIWRPEDVDFIFQSYQIFETKLSDILQILPFAPENKKTWSPELVNLFLDICSITDSILRNILSQGKENEELVEIKDAQDKIISKKVRCLTIDDLEVNLFSSLGLTSSLIIFLTYPLQVIEPYKDYRKDTHNEEGWWTIYNLLKHNRIKNYTRANLDNVINALAGLFILLARYKEEEFSRAYFRYDWTEADLIPNFMSPDRTNSQQDWDFWYTTKLFSVSENPKYMTKNVSDIDFNLAGDKCVKFFGKFKSEI